MQTYILVETEEKRQTLQALLQGKGEVVVVPAQAAVVEAKNVDHLARGQEGFLFQPTAVCHGALKKLLKNGAADIYLAFDRSERGEYSSWLWAGMIGQLSKGTLQCRRLHLAALNAEGLRKAMELVEPVDSGQAACFYFEECFQRCLTTHLQRLLGTSSGPGGMPLSIQVLTILTLLAERQQEVQEFSGTPRWQVELSLKGARGGFAAQLKEFFGVSCDGALAGRDQAKEVAGDLVGQSFRVVSRQENSLKIPAPQPYTLYGLIFDAFRYCQIPVGEAMAAATALSVGVALAGKRQALISSLYPVVLANEQPLVEALQHHVIAQFGQEAVHRRPLVEHGIMPLDPLLKPEELSGMPDVLQKIYDLIWRRALASQMQAGSGKEIILDLQTAKYRLQSDSRLIEEPGFLQVYQYGFADLLAGQAGDALQEGEEAKVAQVVPEQRFGMAPDLYTLPTLADDLAELGIERQDEVVQLLGKLCSADYVNDQSNGTLQCGSNLFKVVNTMNRAFPGMQGMNFVVYYAQTVDEVASGRKRFQMAMKQFDQNLFMQGKPLVKMKMPTSLPTRLQKSKSIIKSDGAPGRREKAVASPAKESPLFPDLSPLHDTGPAQVADQPVVKEAEVSLPLDEGMVPEAKPQAPEVAGAAEEAGALAPEETAEVDGDGEQAIRASGSDSIVLEVAAEESGLAAGEEMEQVFQEAETSGPPAAPPEMAAAPEELEPAPRQEKGKGLGEVATKPCPQCSRAMIRKDDRFGTYWACTGAPACRHTESAAMVDEGEAASCPLCRQGQLLVKRTPTGKNMYVCSRQECEFMAWSQPHPIHCPLCSSPFLVEKKGLRGNTILRCPKAGCNYSQGAEAGAALDAPLKKKRVVVRRKKGGVAGSGTRKVVVRRRKA